MCKRIRFIVILLLSVFFNSYAAIMSESEIKRLAKELELIGNGQYECYSEGRTIIFEFYVNDNSLVKDLNVDKVANSIDEELAVRLSTNLVNIRYIVYYKSNNGQILKKEISVKLSDLMNFNSNTRETISLKNHPKAHNVNLILIKPKGWIARESNRPHIVQKYEVEQDDNFFSYMITMKPFSTFVSKKEAQEIFNGKNKFEIDLKQWINNIFIAMPNATILSEKSCMLGTFPAKRIEIRNFIEEKGLIVKSYGVIWIFFYEDIVISLWGGVNTFNDKGIENYETLFDLITRNIIFPDQYTATDYE